MAKTVILVFIFNLVCFVYFLADDNNGKTLTYFLLGKKEI